MKLSQQTLIGLKRLGNQTLISDECFKSLLKAAASVLCEKSKSYPRMNELSSSKPDIVKESFASLLILMVESARHNLDVNGLTTTLENYSLNLSRLQRIRDLYQAYGSKLQLSLSNVGTSLPRILDIKWRLDLCIKSSALEHESRLVYFITIVTERTERKTVSEEVTVTKKHTFTCSLQQLQELVMKLRDATRLMQSIANYK
ncbi:COMM domain-containing protein 3-like [Macrosteles quadrilineatus]|uniref:COMM domain-containing protein 3-like n=1 Tax=Macrosteles quadrilineatus TaxID=74068 RepID=UPI0023E12932|nr:COMM domain-containing protein 3-like [Macrosteles quadrilineatus]